MNEKKHKFKQQQRLWEFIARYAGAIALKGLEREKHLISLCRDLLRYLNYLINGFPSSNTTTWERGVVEQQLD